MVIFGQSGYVGQRMSVRAAAAYDAGEKPLSRWSKQDILDELPEALAKECARFNVATLRFNCLELTSWHHTGKCANRTDFYGVKPAEEIDPAGFVEIKPEPRKKSAEGDGLYYHGTYEEKTFHPGRRHGKMEIKVISFHNATRKGDWLVMPWGNKKRFDLCQIERTTKRKIKKF